MGTGTKKGQADEACINIEPPDAESESRAAFDADAVPYRVEWSKPNRRRKLWFFESISFGVYRFVPMGPPDREALIALLQNHGECTRTSRSEDSRGASS